MSVWIFLKAFSDLSLYFSVITLLPSLFIHDFSLLWPLLLCSCGAGMASVISGLGRPQLRLLGLLLVTAPLMLVTSVMELLILIPALIYCVVVVLRDHMTVEYTQYRAIFLRTFLIWGICFGIVAMYCSFEEILLAQETSLDYKGAFFYGFLYALSAVILLRLLRMGEESQGSERRMNTLQTVAVMSGTGIVMLGAVAAERYLQTLDRTLLQELWIKLMTALFVPLHWLVQQILGLLPEENKGKIETQATDPASTNPTIEAPPMVEAEPQPVKPAEEAFPWWVAIALLAVLTALMVILLRRYAKKRAVVRTREQADTIQPSARNSRESRRSNRYKVRQLYREFLRSEKGRGLKLRTNQTSEDILESISPDTDPEAAAQLRQVYLYARYDQQGQITREQVDSAKAALKKSRSK